ncbi:16S rRNA (guanine(527)-N(7))-methyltransferase RsmG [Pseudonocardia endophytica]|uniref:Ribosomal RNA small subunit methyltransferase G n=1 Tax=Pseudonocardia endophytica TaxID=401976 RepID=A0A4R1I165_PSEEN|nr:16S rRNA (guanine(527)-N(7))-methyltransferase RsmG [Pseudonocardia endophytica]TCK27661.1 16S rRNA (guanine527-N7)-methyltransferase [Pseudonocardia endophytica]
MTSSETTAEPLPEPPPVAGSVFGDRLPLAVRYVEHLATSGVERGLIGPREHGRLWDRHVLNCAVLGELVPDGAKVVDVGSGAGLPGIPLALARPDLHIVLIEPLARRVDWLDEVVADLGLTVAVERGRAEEKVVVRRWEGADVVTARAVGPLARLTRLCLPLVRPGGSMLVLKGESAAEEIERDRADVRAVGGSDPRVLRCGADVVDPPTTVVAIDREAAPRRSGSRSGSRRKGQRP